MTMKKFTLKQITLGLMLVGYASGSAYAITAVSSRVIQGHAPLLSTSSSTVVAADDQKINVKLYKATDGVTELAATDELAVGDYISVEYGVYSFDGNSEGTSLETASTVVFYYKKGGAWVEADAATNIIERANGKVKWKLPLAVQGATQIGFILQPRTQFGLPTNGDWLNTSDITKAGKMQNTQANQPTNPEGSGGTGGGTVVNFPTAEKPIKNSATYTVRIVYVNDSGGATPADKLGKDYSDSASSLHALVGDTFEAHIWDSDKNTRVIDPNFTYKWYVTGGNAAALGTVADGVYMTGGTNGQFKLPINSEVVLTPASADENKAISGSATASPALAAGKPEAGLQGFKLGVLVE